MEKDKLYQKIINSMATEEQFDDMSMIFTMFSDSTRLKIMNALFTTSELNVSEIAEILQMSHSAISHQLSSLKKTKLVRSRKKGKMVYYSLADDHVKSIFQMAYEHIRE
ncbi:MAG: winged helix-turn-helix transcriptional regulator [Erysipelotrichaceae bacterium]|nr:winged helix-turn-helix transcriptional regulator [Erysipelotrichaceae bacterium]